MSSYKSASLYYIVYLTILLIASVIGKRNPGDACKPAGIDGSGVCKEISSCPKVLNDIRNGEGFPVICGYENQIEIVCCPDNISVVTQQSILSSLSVIISPEERRISDQKCEEYKKYTYENVQNYNKLTNQITNRVIQTCPMESDILSLNKEPAVLKEFPHMAILGYVASTNITRWRCSGILISDEYVLTAAHCATQDAHFVKLGDLILNDDSDGSQSIDVRILDKITHPKFKKHSKYNDIALLRLAEKVPLNPFVRPACLPNKYTIDTQNKVIVTGWVTNTLYRDTLKMVTHSECNSKYKYVGGGLDETQFCAESQIYDANACQSISDGILQVHHSEQCMFTAIAVPILLQLCEVRTYTRVYPYLDWIEGIVWPNE